MNFKMLFCCHFLSASQKRGVHPDAALSDFLLMQ